MYATVLLFTHSTRESFRTAKEILKAHSKRTKLPFDDFSIEMGLITVQHNLHLSK